MTKLSPTPSSYVNQLCDRCGSKRAVSGTWIEEIETSFGTSEVEVSQIVCTNVECQALFDKTREEELAKINERKVKKEEQDKIRRENIAKTISNRKKAKLLVGSK